MGGKYLSRYAVAAFYIVYATVGNALLTLYTMLFGSSPGFIFNNFLKMTEINGNEKQIAFVKDGSMAAGTFWRRTKFILTCAISEITVIAEENGKAPNPKLIRFKDKSECRLLDFAKAGRPLIVNFGSCTWPPFMANLERFREDTEDFSSVADFVLIYIAEAHPTDGWAIKGNVEVANHRTLEERFKAAKKMLDLEPQTCPVLIDPLTDDANKAYAGLPERLYIILDGVIVYKGGRGPMDYRLREVEEWLDKFKGK